MTNIKILLKLNKEKANGQYPIAIRFTKNRKVTFQYIGHTSKEEDWDEEAERPKPTHPQYKTLKVLIANKRAEVEKALLELENKQPLFSLEQLKGKVKRKGGKITFMKYAQQYVQDIIDRGKINVGKSEQSRLNKFKAFAKNRDLDFFEVDVALLKKFKLHLQVEGKSAKTINNHMIMIRTIYNRGIADGLIEREYYPFGGRDKMQLKQVDGQKIGLEETELDSLRKLKLEENSSLWHARNVFLLSFNFAGVRIGDLLALRWSEIQGNRLVYQMGKNNASVSLPLSDEASQILKHYRSQENTGQDLVLPYLKDADWDDVEDTERKRNSATSLLNKKLKKLALLAGIDKTLSNHIARHTFGNISGDKIPLPILQKLYRHKSLNTTAVYQGNFMHKETDDALLKVLTTARKPKAKSRKEFMNDAF